MSKNTNPNLVTESVIDSQSDSKQDNIAIYPVSIFRYAWMERLDSPFINTEVQFSVDTIVPTAYVFTHTPEELRKYTSKDVELLKNDAFTWADTALEMSDMPEIISNITAQLIKLNKASPSVKECSTETTADGNKKKQ